MKPISRTPKYRVGLQQQRGTVALVFTVMLSLIFAAGAFALDIGHALVVRNELQNAADAGALAGARALLKPGASMPNWAAADADSATIAGLNGSDGIALVQSVVQSGYWNVTGTPVGLQPPSRSPALPSTPRRPHACRSN